MSPFRTYRPEFEAVLGDSPRLDLVVETDAHEGPVYFAHEDALYFTTLPRPRRQGSPHVEIKRVALDGERFPLDSERINVVRAEGNGANGMAADDEQRLVICEQGTDSTAAAIGRLDRHNGRREILVDTWRDLPFNSPNDCVVKADGTIWFTDPSYGYLQGFKAEPRLGDYVYRYDATTGELSVVADSFDKPNGLAFSPDERVLYVGDSGANQETGSFYPQRPHRVKAFDVVNGRRLVNERLFSVIAPGFPDGIKVDNDGRVYASSFSGVQVFDPAGDLIGEIHLPGAVNFTFGGRAGNILFITADRGVWAAVLKAVGPPTLGKESGSTPKEVRS